MNLKALSRTGTVVKTWRLYGMNGRRTTYVRASVGEFTGDGLTDIALHIPLVEGSGTLGNRDVRPHAPGALHEYARRLADDGRRPQGGRAPLRGRTRVQLLRSRRPSAGPSGRPRRSV